MFWPFISLYDTTLAYNYLIPIFHTDENVIIWLKFCSDIIIQHFSRVNCADTNKFFFIQLKFLFVFKKQMTKMWDRTKAPTFENVDDKIVFYAVILRFGDIECTSEVILFYIRHTK